MGQKEKIASYENMLKESKVAYMQLDDTYKGIIEKAQNEKIQAIKQHDKTYNTKIKSKNFDDFDLLRFGGKCETAQANRG